METYNSPLRESWNFNPETLKRLEELHNQCFHVLRDNDFYTLCGKPIIEIEPWVSVNCKQCLSKIEVLKQD